MLLPLLPCSLLVSFVHVRFFRVHQFRFHSFSNAQMEHSIGKFALFRCIDRFGHLLESISDLIVQLFDEFMLHLMHTIGFIQFCRALNISHSIPFEIHLPRKLYTSQFVCVSYVHAEIQKYGRNETLFCATNRFSIEQIKSMHFIGVRAYVLCRLITKSNLHSESLIEQLQMPNGFGNAQKYARQTDIEAKY